MKGESCSKRTILDTVNVSDKSKICVGFFRVGTSVADPNPDPDPPDPMFLGPSDPDSDPLVRGMDPDPDPAPDPDPSIIIQK